MQSGETEPAQAGVLIRPVQQRLARLLVAVEARVDVIGDRRLRIVQYQIDLFHNRREEMY